MKVKQGKEGLEGIVPSLATQPWANIMAMLSRGHRELTLGSPLTRLNTKLQVSTSHMQVLKTPAGNKYLCFKKEISSKAECFVNRRRSKNFEVAIFTGL